MDYLRLIVERHNDLREEVKASARYWLEIEGFERCHHRAALIYNR
jgi:hypothetical protein